MELKKINKRLKTVPVADLKLYPGNPRRNNESAKMVAKSIAAFGYINPIVVNPDNYILAGNTRCKALRILGVEEIDVLEVSGLTEQEERNFVIVDNRVGEFSQTRLWFGWRTRLFLRLKRQVENRPPQTSPFG